MKDSLDRKIKRILNEEETFMLSLIMLSNLHDDEKYSELCELIFLFDNNSFTIAGLFAFTAKCKADQPSAFVLLTSVPFFSSSLTLSISPFSIELKNMLLELTVSSPLL